MATATKADLEARIAELEAQVSAPAAEPSPLERRKANADNTTVGIITGIFPIKRRDGSPTGGYRVRVKIGAQVNFGTNDEPNRRRINVEEIFFAVWDNGTPANPNPVATKLAGLMSTVGWACCRLYWEYSATARAVQVREVINEETGDIRREEFFAYTPDRRIFAFDCLSSGGAAPASRRTELSLAVDPEEAPAPYSAEPTSEEIPF